MNSITLIPATKETNGLVAKKINGNLNSIELHKQALNGRDNGCVATVNKSGVVAFNGSSWRKEFEKYNGNLQELVNNNWTDLKTLF